MCIRMQLYTIVTFVYDARAQKFKRMEYVKIMRIYCPRHAILKKRVRYLIFYYGHLLSGIIFFYSAHLCVKRVHNPLSIELRAGEDIKTRGNYNSRYKKYFTSLFCTRIIVSVDNSFTWNQSARRVRQIYADGLQTWEKRKKKT